MLYIKYTTAYTVLENEALVAEEFPLKKREKDRGVNFST
jgi:hypothetical protein